MDNSQHKYKKKKKKIFVSSSIKESIKLIIKIHINPLKLSFFFQSYTHQDQCFINYSYFFIIKPKNKDYFQILFHVRYYDQEEIYNSRLNINNVLFF